MGGKSVEKDETQIKEEERKAAAQNVTVTRTCDDRVHKEKRQSSCMRLQGLGLDSNYYLKTH